MNYKSNYIKNVILKIDFSSIENFSIEKFDFLKNYYPQYKNELVSDYQAVFSKDVHTVDKKDRQLHQYFDSTMENAVKISNNTVFFELKRHIGYLELKNKFIEIFNILKSDFKIENIDRIGLRYINIINLDNKNYKKLFNKNLLSNLSFLDTLNKSKNAKFKKILLLGRLSLKNEDTVVNFVYGNKNNNYPAVSIDNDFLLDIDSYVINVSSDDCLNKIDILHNNIIYLFENSITDEFRNLLNL